MSDGYSLIICNIESHTQVALISTFHYNLRIKKILIVCSYLSFPHLPFQLYPQKKGWILLDQEDHTNNPCRSEFLSGLGVCIDKEILL